MTAPARQLEALIRAYVEQAGLDAAKTLCIDTLAKLPAPVPPGGIDCDTCFHTIVEDGTCCCPAWCATCASEDCCAEAWAPHKAQPSDLPDPVEPACRRYVEPGFVSTLTPDKCIRCGQPRAHHGREVMNPTTHLLEALPAVTR